MDRADRKDVKDAGFDVVLRGYDKRQVDERMRILVSKLAAAENALQEANQRTALLEDALGQLRSASGSESPGDVNFGARVEKILKLAEDEAREVRSQAEAAAVVLMDQARSQAAEQRQRAEQEIVAWRAEANRQAAEQENALQRRSAELDSARQEIELESERSRARARAEADQIRATITAKADELVRAAAAEADDMGKTARTEADHLVSQAREEAERLVAVANEAARKRERSSAHELHQLSRLREEINADLYRVKDALDGLFGSSGNSPGIILPKRRKDGSQPPHQARTV